MAGLTGDPEALEDAYQGAWNRSIDEQLGEVQSCSAGMRIAHPAYWFGYRSHGPCGGCIEHVKRGDEGVELRTTDDGRHVVLCGYCAEASRWFDSLSHYRTARHARSEVES